MSEINTDELKHLNQKRRALDKLIAFTKQISQLSKSIELAREIVKPSQQPSRKLFPILKQLMEHTKAIKSENLVISLNKIDDDIRRELHEILELSDISEEQFTERLAKYKAKDVKTAYEHLIEEVNDFKRKTQTDVAIRYELTQRGMPVQSGALEIDQEALNTKAVSLKKQESQCKEKIQSSIQVLIEDTQNILNNTTYPDDLKNKIAEIQGELKDNLNALNTETDFEKIPVFVASYELFSNSSDSTTPDPDPTPESSGENKTSANNSLNTTHSTNEIWSPEELDSVEKAPLSRTQPNLFQLIKIWLTSPWQVTWQEIKAKHWDK